MSSQLSSPPNHTPLYLAAAYALAFPPHLYYFGKMMAVTKGQGVTNILPRTNLESLRSKISTTDYSKLVKARGMHLNALEGFPLFAAAMIAGNMAKVPNAEMNGLAAQYIGVRILYNVCYMAAGSELASYLRTGVYAWSVGIPFWILWKAANARKMG